jgi:hypothetical protein
MKNILFAMVPRQNVQGQNTQREKMSAGTKLRMDKSSVGTKHPEIEHLWEKTSGGKKCSEILYLFRLCF